jgi:hypothetical protein
MEAFKEETLDYNYDWSCWFEARDMDAFDDDQWKHWLEHKKEGARLLICGKYREHGCLRWRWFASEDGLAAPLGPDWTSIELN